MVKVENLPNKPIQNPSDTPKLTCARHPEDTLSVRLSGEWNIGWRTPSSDAVWKEAGGGPLRRLVLEGEGLSSWDSALITFILGLLNESEARGVIVDRSRLPEGVGRLLKLATKAPDQKEALREANRESVLERIGGRTLGVGRSWMESLEFFGRATLACLSLLRGRARFRFSEFLVFLQECGGAALPVVTLISVLVGVILAFVGAVQLRMFGAQLYIADLVGLGMARDMGAMMTAIIMAGRTGAAFAAQLGTMQVNEEIDALSTMGVSPMEFLVLPRLLALTLMMPLLCVYADFLGILGGAIVGVSMFDIPALQYYEQTKAAVPLHHFAAGLIKSAAYGIIVALSGCLRGIQCGRSASAVGRATTSAVVTAIIWIIVSCSVLTVIFHLIGI